MIALQELQTTIPDLLLLEWLAPGIGLVELEQDWKTLAKNLGDYPPIFCRHICPVQISIPLEQHAGDLHSLDQLADFFIPFLNLEQTFSVQTRFVGNGTWIFKRYDVNVMLSDRLKREGAALDVRNPEQVLSVVCTPARAYLGFSLAAENLSTWAGGVHRFKREKEQISRAEFKLLEILSLFQLRFPAGGTALDLGAAPGGWTRILCKHAMRVVAVDPADLDLRVRSNPAVSHVRQTAQTYLPTGEQFDIILDDMRMDALASARIMLLAASSLKPDGLAILTLKLPKRSMASTATSALKLLQKGYLVVGARQLFHNRHEITAALKKAE
jgi:23S rRNA (cytidine2498-2'-O)-methyltransferase